MSIIFKDKGNLEEQYKEQVKKEQSEHIETIIITGSSRGLGSEIAKEASRRQFMYYGMSRWGETDVGKYEDVKKYFSELIIYDDRCPIALINNAGICKTGSILEMSPEDWREQININLNGVFYCSKEYIKMCRKFKFPGKIINIASTAGTGARPGRAGYSASKSAVINFSFSLAEEIKPDGMKVYCIAPGAFVSDMRREIAPDDNFERMLKPSIISKFIMDIVENGEFLDNQLLYIKG